MDYKKKYEEAKEELEEIKLKSISPKEQIVEKIAKLFGDESFREVHTYQYEGKEKSYITFKGIYKILFDRIGKDDLFYIHKKIVVLTDSGGKGE